MGQHKFLTGSLHIFPFRTPFKNHIFLIRINTVFAKSCFKCPQIKILSFFSILLTMKLLDVLSDDRYLMQNMSETKLPYAKQNLKRLNFSKENSV